MNREIKIRRTVRPRRRSLTQERKIKAARRYFQKHKPSFQQLLKEGNLVAAMPWEELLGLQDVFKALHELRQEQGLSLAALAKRSGIGKAALSRLESGVQANFTISTISRYAAALGASIRISLKRGKRTD